MKILSLLALLASVAISPVVTATAITKSETVVPCTWVVVVTTTYYHGQPAIGEEPTISEAKCLPSDVYTTQYGVESISIDPNVGPEKVSEMMENRQHTNIPKLDSNGNIIPPKIVP